MALLVGGKDTVEVPIEVALTVDGEQALVKFQGVFRRFGRKRSKGVREEYQALAEEVDALTDTGDGSEPVAAKQAEAMQQLEGFLERQVRANFVGWRELVGVDGDLVPYTEEVMEEMLDHVAYFGAIKEAMWKATGQASEEAIQGNSEPQAATSP